ncbi:MAG TPA: hypothetical protein VF163_16045, partial [Micromonosporaceae bacterium]
MSSDPDLDRLADYAAGALDRVAAARVAWFIEFDPRWRAAYAALLDADTAVRADLQRAAQDDHVPMPADIASRLDAALAAESAAAGPTRTPDVAADPTRSRVVSLDAARARRRRLATTIAAAAAAVVAVVGGLGIAGDLLRSARDSAMPSSALPGGKAESGSDGGPAVGAPSPRTPTFDNQGDRVIVVASGVDYQPGT